MPLSKLEYTQNIKIPTERLPAFFAELHLEMVNIINTDLPTCKSSASILENYCVGDDDGDAGFIVLYIQILPGRTPSQIDQLKKVAAQKLMDLLVATDCAMKVQVRVLISVADELLYHMEDH